LRISGTPESYAITSLVYDPEEQAREASRVIDFAIHYGRELGISKKDHLVF